MELKEGLLVVFVILFFAPLGTAAHFIIGQANDALDTTAANGRTVVIWNPANGITDNVTDIVGPTGNSGVGNVYMVDCELLSTPCVVNDILRAKILDDGFGRTSYESSIAITGTGFDLMPNLTLNSLPTVLLAAPPAGANVSGTAAFQCNVEDLDGDGENVTLYGSWNGGWHPNETRALFGVSSSNYFYKDLDEGVYTWNCRAEDTLRAIVWASANRTLTVDHTAPLIATVTVNETHVCGPPEQVEVRCTVTDALSGIETVIVEATSPGGSYTVTASSIGGDVYSADLLINETGQWQFTCIANDSAGNTATKDASNLTSYPNEPNLVVFSNYIAFSNEDPIESENITISSLIFNNGCTAGGFLVGFYEGNPDTGGVQIGSNKSMTLQGLSNDSIFVSWLAEIGKTNVFVKADVADTITEINETDNLANNTISVQAWQDFYGIISSSKLLANAATSRVDLWANASVSGGNIFITDSESEINWEQLQAIGKNLTNGSTTNDFVELDSILGMGTFEDSIADTFTSDGSTPLSTRNITVNRREISNIPIINSTNTTSFITGILWDASDDSDGEFGLNDDEDIVFITNINKSTAGYYGTYDYEIRIPVKLREQNSFDTSQVYLYYELESS